MVVLYKDPTGEEIFTTNDTARSELKISENLFDDAMLTDQQKIAALIQKIKQFEKDVEVFNIAIIIIIYNYRN